MNSEPLKDERWCVYQERFHTLPVFCFNDLKYPESYEEAIMQMSRLELEQKNIESQFAERETELESVLPADADESMRQFRNWKTKALRAQRMKFSQIRILEAWMLDFPPTYDERIKALELKNQALEEKTQRLEDRINRLPS